MDRKCKKYANRSCYICGRFPDCQAKVKDFLKKAYQAYSGIILGNNHKPSAPSPYLLQNMYKELTGMEE